MFPWCKRDISRFLKIGNDVFVGMHAAVTHDVKDGSVVVAEGAKVLPLEDRRARMIKKKYFNV